MNTNPLTTAPNPLIQRSSLPGEIHRLPSRGLFYDEGVLDPNVRDGEVEVHAMTLLDEITVKSPDLLFSGDAIKQVISRCVPQILKPEELLAKDVDFLMLVLRKTSYGDVDIDYLHDCTNAKEHMYRVPVDNLIKSAKGIDPTTIGSKFSLRLPNDMVVKVQPLRFQSMIDMLQLNDKQLDPTEAREIAVSALLGIIISVDEITDKEMIKDWLKTIPTKWTTLIDQSITGAQNDWGPELTYKFNCKDCGEEVETIIPMNPLAFFI